MFGILKEFIRGKFDYHLCSEFYRNLLEGSLVIIYASKHDVCCTRLKVRNGARKINFPLETKM